ncbi:MAG TPA: hypothetical protein VF254_03645 [Gammaproteobacteria bacterium]
MGVTKGRDFDDFNEDDFEGDNEVDPFGYIEDAAERRRAAKAHRSNKASWRSVEDYLENRKLKRQLSDGFDDE